MDIKIIKNIVYWALPQGLFDVALKTRFRLRHGHFLKLLRGNSRYRDIQRGKRCFIVCNGPSVKSQNLLPLKDEIVFSVSSGYHHKDYAIYKPKYHCVPPITYTEKFTKEVAISWFREMHEKTGDAELFLGYPEEPLVRENNLFPGRKVNYLCMYGEFSKNSTRLVDITRIVPGVCSVPVMCLMIAMYMGFKQIYILGADHDSFRSNTYKYFFESTILKNKDFSVNNDGMIRDPLYDVFHSYALLWNQYRMIKKIAHAHGAIIYNATEGGALDEFERVLLETIVNIPAASRGALRAQLQRKLRRPLL